MQDRVHIELRDLSRSYATRGRSRAVLDDVSASIRHGEFLVLVGSYLSLPGYAVAAALGVVLAAVYRALTWQRLKEAVYLTARTSAMVCWLLSPAARRCTGADFVVDAGWTAGTFAPGMPGF